MSTELKELALKIMESNMTDDTKIEILFYMFSHIEKENPYNPYNPYTITYGDGYHTRSVYNGDNGDINK